MLDDPPGLGPGLPQPYDVVCLRPGNRFGIGPAVPLTVAGFGLTDDVRELHQQEQHPGFWDWAAGASAADVLTIVRYNTHSARSWAPPHPAEETQ
ncbi:MULTISPECIES: DUF6211 family protein [Streptomyces]|uniref:DUF6211 family protein n=2 Tax=Streptomyces TaxID=1883 RepID=A0ABU4K305_9ACTN|nr:DUF6211 family protein [Streptomyces roseolus]MDX2291805.1 DUF6211 family protein [Streptomyces roseolus]